MSLWDILTSPIGTYGFWDTMIAVAFVLLVILVVAVAMSLPTEGQ